MGLYQTKNKIPTAKGTELKDRTGKNIYKLSKFQNTQGTPTILQEKKN
jgi:hypothetical protein